MSEKVIDPTKLLSLVRPEASARDRRLFDMRLEEEAQSEANEARAKAMTQGAPAIPDAQLVFNEATQTVGVAVRGARLICQLPKGYGGPGLELALMPGDRLIAVQPGMSPLLIDPQTGTTRRL
ncbi:MAG: hypothetical protein ACREJM_15965 [Candidatus Saccharimonadales bacterium]